MASPRTPRAGRVGPAQGRKVRGGMMPRSEVGHGSVTEELRLNNRKDDKGAIPCERVNNSDGSERSGRGSSLEGERRNAQISNNNKGMPRLRAKIIAMALYRLKYYLISGDAICPITSI